ncbi:sensor histidine kinase [Lactiplantibacillus daowaiensis]|uniref:Sensor histidine kinase n=1 Tax=Lactiplantibacillus daowaiensis TaxID=2559918 RepID=A0ABW1RYE7_9LACO|nr:GHKL domain-containing protein [Lactiplantibacillus daowaiensis]
MTGFLYILSLVSGSYEMVIFMLAFREYVTWKLGLVWVGLVIFFGVFGQLATTWWPQVPLVFFWVVPITIVNTIMSARLLYTKWILMMPVAIFLNAIKRLIGGLAGVFLKWVMSSNAPLTLRQSVQLHNWAANINLFGAAILCIPVILVLGFWAHHWVVKNAAADFFQHAKIDYSDYLLVLLFYGLYILAYAFALELSVNLQMYVAIAASIVFGIIGFYLVNNKNSRLTDAQLLEEMSNYNELLSHRNQELHLFKHDYQNILLSLSQYIQSDDLPGLKHYYEQEVLPAGDNLSGHAGPEQLRYLQAPEISGLIYSKYEAAASRDVQLQLALFEPVSLPPVAHVNIVRILGNLLDNAIDAASQVDRQVYLLITPIPHSDTVTFTVRNRIPAGDTIHLNRIRKSRFTTKKGHLGYGLSSIEQLATKQVHVDYQIDAENFTATLTIEKPAKNH